MFTAETIIFSVFIIFIFGMLMVDLLFVGRKSHVISLREATAWTAVWISFALLFYVFIRFHGEKIHGIENMDQLKEKVALYKPNLPIVENDFESGLEVYRKNMSMEFITGYLIEYTLSIDNVFVIIMILGAFIVRPMYYKQVLFWGILGAIILRFIFIFVGAALIQKFEWILLVFGGFLIYSGVDMFLKRNKSEKIEPQKHWLVKYLSKHLPIYPRYVKKNFFVRQNHKTYITPLFIVLMLIEFTDLIFAFDSIPAIFAITLDPYIVFFSNIFAIIGLRSLFFLLIKVVDVFHYLKIGVAVLLAFVGCKLLFHGFLDQIGFKTVYSLIFILSVIAISILASLAFPPKKFQV